MTSGGPGDHPISDIITWRLDVYSAETDALILKIASLCSRRELYEWWEKEIGWQAPLNVASEKSASYYRQLMKRAQQSGWEKPE